jgi:hypothetical protein
VRLIPRILVGERSVAFNSLTSRNTRSIGIVSALVLTPKLLFVVAAAVLLQFAGDADGHTARQSLEKVCRTESIGLLLVWAPIFESLAVALMAYVLKEIRLHSVPGASLIAFLAGWLHWNSGTVYDGLLTAWIFWFFGYVMMAWRAQGWWLAFGLVVAWHFLFNLSTVAVGCVAAHTG